MDDLENKIDLASFDTEKLIEWLQHSCGLTERMLNVFREEEISGRNLVNCKTISDLVNLVTDLKRGPAETILTEMNKLERTDSGEDATGNSTFPIKARRFREPVRGMKYAAGAVLGDEYGKLLVESGPDNPNLLHPIREFKKFVSISRDKNLKSFFLKAMKFIFACINSRANGTIYFGVEDKSVRVTGTELDDITIEEISDELQIALTNVLNDQAKRSIILHCLHNPKFIEVEHFGSQRTLFVIEIDVESKYQFVGSDFFEVDFSRLKGVAEKGLQLLVRHGTSTKKLGPVEAQGFVHNLPKLSERRRLAESSYHHMPHDQKGPSLQGMLKLNEAQFLVLILDKTSDPSNDLSFIGKYIKWRAVIDLNSDSSLHDDYENYRQTRTMTIDNFGEDLFQLESDTERTWWLYANGHDETNRPVQKLEQWKGAREEGISFLTRQLRYMSNNNCLAVFLFLADSDGVMSEIYRRFYDSGFCKCVYIAQYERALEFLREKLEPKKIEVGINGMVELPWHHVDSVFRNASGQMDPECEISTSSGASVIVKRDNWTDIEIVGAKECAKELSNPHSSDRFRLERRRFYNGNPVSWLNCALSRDVLGKDRHIVKRSEHETLKRNIESSKYTPGRPYVILNVYHNPGAGGSTLARHVLWELKDRYKCGIIKISNEYGSEYSTKRQIEELYRYGEKGVPITSLKPVILVLDHPNQEMTDIFLNDLNQNQDLEELVCVVINCRRTTEESSHSQALQKVFRHGLDIFVRQKFSDKDEKLQFMGVLDDLTGRQNLKLEVDLMLGFMALISDHVGEYVQKTIQCYVDSSEDWERELITYIALLNTYNSEDPDIPIAFFDFLIPENLRHSFTQWGTLNRPCAIFCTIGQKHEIGDVSCIRIKLHPLFAKALLRHLRPGKLSDLVFQFLNCKGFASQSFSRQVVIKMTTNMIKKRRFDSARPSRPDKTTEYKYSDLINDILSEEKAFNSEKCSNFYNGAVKVVKMALEVLKYREFEDPFLAQLVARVMYLEARNYEEALTFAERATHLLPNNSFLQDTVGQIYREKLNNEFTTFTGSPMSEHARAIALSRKAITWFNRAIEASETMKEVNYSPHMGLVGIYKSLYKMLPCCAEVVGPNNLFEYLSEADRFPGEIAIAWNGHHDFMKSLSRNCALSLKSALDKLTMIRPVQSSVGKLESRKSWMVENVMDSFLVYTKFWPDEDLSDGVQSNPVARRAWNSKMVEHLGGLSFYTIMELGQKGETRLNDLLRMKHLLEENAKSEPYSVIDMERLIYVYLSLSTSEILNPGHVPAFQIFGLCARLGEMTERSKRRGIYNLVMSMLMWPQENMFGITYNDKILRSVLKSMKHENQFVGRNTESDLDYYKRTGRRRINYKARTEFYLRKYGTKQRLIYGGYVQKRADKRYSDDKFWSHAGLEDVLARATGVIKGSELMAYNCHTKDYDIPVQIAHSNSALSRVYEATVQFYLGFSWDGPRAYSVEKVNRQVASPVGSPVPPDVVQSK